ncbi:DPY30 domain-containing protein 1 isoform X2 [Macrotis lagotis]|uniref:DPY30 domain-containing protein 1 isoform X2 n=1 Tax=Macrotis lagotis TaxID=92651 RepID=UPI003D6930D3
METRYLQKFLGQCLTQALADLVKYHPADPIEYLAFWLYQYKKNLVAEELRQVELAQLRREQELARIEQEMLEQMKAEELLFQEQQIEMEMLESKRLALEELEKDALKKTLAEISDRYGAPNLSRVEELDEPTVSDVALANEKEGKEQ